MPDTVTTLEEIIVFNISQGKLLGFTIGSYTYLSH